MSEILAHYEAGLSVVLEKTYLRGGGAKFTVTETRDTGTPIVHDFITYLGAIYKYNELVREAYFKRVDT